MDEKILIENTMEVASEEDIITKKLHVPMTRIDMEENVLVSGSTVTDGSILHIDPIISEERDLVECIFEENETITYIDESAEEAATATANIESQENEDDEEEKDESSDDGRGMIDKDDPRSRLHFVKYLKRGGKTLKIWECGICAKEFRHQYTLMRHLPTHTDERNFKCDMCGKAFRQMSTLSQHRAIHSDARPYVCEICKKTFNRVSTLISHRKTHSDKKPHMCNVCGKGFHQKGNLRNHIFTHTNERPYRCNTCGKGFNQMSNLMCHKVKLCEAESAKNSIRNLENENLSPRLNNKFIEVNVGDKRLRNKKNVKFVTVSDAGVEVSSLDKSACDMEDDEDLGTPTAGVSIEPIDTKAMRMARLQGQTPFALLKPARGIPVLVKVVDDPSNSRQMLVPATAEDLKNAGKVTVSPSAQSEAVKAVQIKVPVVATVIQKMLPDGSLTIIVEPPTNEQFGKAPNELQVESTYTESQMHIKEEEDEELDEAEEEVESAENVQYIIEEDGAEWIVESEGGGICIETEEQFAPPEVYVLEEIIDKDGTEEEAEVLMS